VSDTIQRPVEGTCSIEASDNMDLEEVSGTPRTATDCLKVEVRSVWKNEAVGCKQSFVQVQLRGNSIQASIPMSISRVSPGIEHSPLYIFIS
jgi:hypothetical protein